MTDPEPDLVSDAAYAGAEIGDVLQDSDERPVPEAWHLMDGGTLTSYEWPDFVARMGIADPTFVLPAPQRSISEHHWIIKLGEHRPLPKAAAPEDHEEARRSALRRR